MYNITYLYGRLKFDIIQTEAAWLGFYGVVGTCIACIVVARYANFSYSYQFASHILYSSHRFLHYKVLHNSSLSSV